MKKAVALIALSILLHFPFSCDYPSYGRYEYSVNTIDIRVGELSDRQLESRDFTPPISDTVSIAEFAIQLEITDFSSKKISFAGGLMSASYADPAPPNFEIAEISITSDQSISAESEVHEAGALLNSLFDGTHYHSLPRSVENFQVCCGYWEPNTPLFLTISKPIDHLVNQKFFIKVVLTNGQIFELETENVIVKP